MLSGAVIRDGTRNKLKKEVARMKKKPVLVIIQIGSRKESDTYIRQKIMFGENIGVKVLHEKFPENISENKLLAKIAGLNKDKAIDGIIVQLPFPKRLNKEKILNSIAPGKDVDGMTAQNIRSLWTGEEKSFLPATVRGIITLLSHYKIPLSGKRIVIVGRSILVGKPLAMAMLNRNATVTVCHSHTKNLADETKRADILIVAAGKPNLIGKKHISRGQIVVDVGINSVKGKLAGDVDFEAVKDIVRAISPVPGGVGPLTVASLFENVVRATEH